MKKPPKKAKAVVHRRPRGGALIDAVDKDQITVVQRLLARGADINEETPDGYTPLHLAIYLNFRNIARLLLKHGADVHKRNEYGSTLTTAAWKGNIKIIPLLIEQGTDLQEKDDNGCTACDIARHRGDIEMREFLEGVTLRQQQWLAAAKRETEDRRKQALHSATTLTRNLPYKKSPFKLPARA